MDDFPTKIADFLEETALKIRRMTVDRVRAVAKWTALGMVLSVLVVMAVFFLVVGLFRLLGELIGYRNAYTLIGGLFVLAGAFLWSRRLPREPSEVTENDD